MLKMGFNSCSLFNCKGMQSYDTKGRADIWSFEQIPKYNETVFFKNSVIIGTSNVISCHTIINPGVGRCQHEVINYHIE